MTRIRRLSIRVAAPPGAGRRARARRPAARTSNRSASALSTTARSRASTCAPRSSPARISSTASSSRSSAPASLEVTAVTDSLCCTVSVTTPLSRDSATNVHTLADHRRQDQQSGGDDESKTKATRDHRRVHASPYRLRFRCSVVASMSSMRAAASSDGACATTLSDVFALQRARATPARRRVPAGRSQSASDEAADTQAEIGRLEHVARRQNDGALHGVAQLTQIPWPARARASPARRPAENVKPGRRCFRPKTAR